jgi:hypothetical protein
MTYQWDQQQRESTPTKSERKPMAFQVSRNQLRRRVREKHTIEQASVHALSAIGGEALARAKS